MIETRDLTNTPGNLLGWQQFELPDVPGGSHGLWSVQSGKSSPLSRLAIALPRRLVMTS